MRGSNVDNPPLNFWARGKGGVILRSPIHRTNPMNSDRINLHLLDDRNAITNLKLSVGWTRTLLPLNLYC